MRSTDRLTVRDPGKAPSCAWRGLGEAFPLAPSLAPSGQGGQVPGIAWLDRLSTRVGASVGKSEPRRGRPRAQAGGRGLVHGRGGGAPPPVGLARPDPRVTGTGVGLPPPGAITHFGCTRKRGRFDGAGRRLSTPERGSRDQAAEPGRHRCRWLVSKDGRSADVGAPPLVTRLVGLRRTVRVSLVGT